MNIICLVLLAYLLGSIPSGVWIGKKFYNTDIRDSGSGNIGTTNTFRVLGMKAGCAVLICDILKGTLATCLPSIFHVQGFSPMLLGIAAVIGHTFSIFVKFKGGKAVATSAGMLLGVQPHFFGFVIIIFIICLFLSSMVSFSSIVASISAVLGLLLFPLVHCFIYPKVEPLFTVIVLCLAIFILFRHRENIQRMRKHEENTVPFGLNLLKNTPKQKS